MFRGILFWIFIGFLAILLLVLFGRLTFGEGIQILLAYGLVLVTAAYAMETSKMRKSSEDTANAAFEQAKASNEMVIEMRKQRLNAYQPVIWPLISGWGLNTLNVIFENIGNGPALDIDIFLGRGDDPIINDCEHDWYSYMIAGDKKTSKFLMQPPVFDSYGGMAPLESSVLNKLVGKYTLLVEWRDLHMSGPFFRAKLPFSLVIDSSGKLSVKEETVNIEPIDAKRKLVT